MDTNLVSEGLKFMVLGMVTVYLFLMLMIFILNIQSRIIHKFSPSKKLKIAELTVSSDKISSNDDETLVAVITAAIQQYENQKT